MDRASETAHTKSATRLIVIESCHTPCHIKCYFFFIGFNFQGGYNQIPQIAFVSQVGDRKSQIRVSGR